MTRITILHVAQNWICTRIRPSACYSTLQSKPKIIQSSPIVNVVRLIQWILPCKLLHSVFNSIYHGPNTTSIPTELQMRFRRPQVLCGDAAAMNTVNWLQYIWLSIQIQFEDAIAINLTFVLHLFGIAPCSTFDSNATYLSHLFAIIISITQ